MVTSMLCKAFRIWWLRALGRGCSNLRIDSSFKEHQHQQHFLFRAPRLSNSHVLVILGSFGIRGHHQSSFPPSRLTGVRPGNHDVIFFIVYAETYPTLPVACQPPRSFLHVKQCNICDSHTCVVYRLSKSKTWTRPESSPLASLAIAPTAKMLPSDES